MRMKIEWTPEMSVGDKTIDNQHQGMLNQLNKLKKELAGGVDIRSIREIICFLDNYIKEHLAYEEEFMKKHKYPYFKSHKKQHELFIKNYNDFKKKFDEKYHSKFPSINDIKGLLIEEEKILSDWWTNHVLKEDQKCAAYIKKHKS